MGVAVTMTNTNKATHTHRMTKIEVQYTAIQAA